MGTANIAWPGLPSGTGLSPGLASPCHCYLDNALGSTPPNLLIILVLLMAWPGPCDPSHTYQCAFNAILTPSDLTDSFSPGQILGFLLGEPGEQHLYQITLRLPARRPGRPALVQFLRPGAMKQKHIPPHARSQNAHFQGPLCTSFLSRNTGWWHFGIYQISPVLFFLPFGSRFGQTVRS